MPYCSNCGSQIQQQAKFCPNCGTPVGAGEARPPTGYQVRAQETANSGSDAEDYLSDPYLRQYKPIQPDANLPFRLQDGEVILKEFRPSKRVIAKFAVNGLVGIIFLFIFIVPFVISILPSVAASNAFLYAVAIIVGLIAAFLLIGGLFGYLGYTKYRYWITNHRTIGRRGMVGYSLDSMPLENVADVIVMRGVFDRILGIASIYVQPIGGSGFMMPVRGFGMNRYSGSNSFMGLQPQETPEIQQLIFHLRDIRKRETGRVL